MFNFIMFIKSSFFHSSLFFIGLSCFVFSQEDLNINALNKNSEWLIADFIKANHVQLAGNPQLNIDGLEKVVCFDGIDDAIFLNQNPLEGLKEFTVEMIFKPAFGGEFEQRVLHIGEVSGDRMLLEIRALDGNWYFDGFVASNGNKLALAHEELLHPLGQWYHVALVVSKNSLSTYVNGNLELSEPYIFNPISGGKSSIGVRLNNRSWFKGCVYKVRISSKVLQPNQFMPFYFKGN